MIQPKVSIITVCLNSAKTIRDTIKSVESQAYDNIEYIIVDGGSQDGTVDIISESTAVTKWISEPDKGISDAFNKGLSLASGEYIQIINSDDWLGENQIMIAVKCLEEDETAGFVFGNIYLCAYDKKNKFFKPGDELYEKKIANRMPQVNHPTFLVRKMVYEQFGGFDEKYKIALDYEWLSRVTKQGVRGIYCPILTAYMRDGGISTKNLLQVLKESRKISLKNGYAKFGANWFFMQRLIKRLCYFVVNFIIGDEITNKIKEKMHVIR